MKRQNNNKIYRYSKINMAEILENLLMRRNENRRIVHNMNDIKKDDGPQHLGFKPWTSLKYIILCIILY